MKKTLKAQWEEFRRDRVEFPISDRGLRNLHEAFMAGALCAVVELNQASKLPGAVEPRLEELKREIVGIGKNIAGGSH